MGLVITRRVGESILIGKDIVITVDSFHTNTQVRIDVDAPRGVDVNRVELLGRSTPNEALARAGENHCARCGGLLRPRHCQCPSPVLKRRAAVLQ